VDFEPFLQWLSLNSVLIPELEKEMVIGAFLFFIFKLSWRINKANDEPRYWALLPCENRPFAWFFEPCLD
jgi:hypothetical protein